MLSFFTRLRVFRFFQKAWKDDIIIRHTRSKTLTRVLCSIQLETKKFPNNLLTTVNITFLNERKVENSQIEREKIEIR